MLDYMLVGPDRLPLERKRSNRRLACPVPLRCAKIILQLLKAFQEAHVPHQRRREVCLSSTGPTSARSHCWASCSSRPQRSRRVRHRGGRSPWPYRERAEHGSCAPDPITNRDGRVLLTVAQSGDACVAHGHPRSIRGRLHRAGTLAPRPPHRHDQARRMRSGVALQREARRSP